MMTAQGGFELRPLSASRLLTIRREVLAMELADELERSLVGNALVLAACCEKDGRPVFADGQAVLNRLTAPQMEQLLRKLTEQEKRTPAAVTAQQDGAMNESFDEERFLRMKEGNGWIM